MSDDPFAEPTDTDATIIRPRPQGRAAASGPAIAAPRPAASTATDAVSLPTVGVNPLVAAAAPVLAAALRIAGGAQPADTERFRRSMVEAMRQFERDALATGLDTRSLRAARYALCATVDDLVFSTPWGGTSVWAQQSLTSIFHNEVSGGERFFDILEQMGKDLGHHGEVVELMYLCVALGFEGRYRVMPRGVAALNELRESVYRMLRNRRGDFERELSPHWRGEAAGLKPLSQRVPLWAIGLGGAVIALAIYLVLNFSLAGTSDEALATLAALPPRGGISVPREAPAAPPPAPPAAVSEGGAAAKLHQFLAPEIREGLVSVFEDAQSVGVRLTNKTFASGQAVLAPGYLSLLSRIGEALQDEPGSITVKGYTDNQPIRTVRFPSNFQLSAERATAVARVIAAKLSDPARVHAEGLAEADPVASNATAEGRAQNRRTDIILTRIIPASAP